MTTHHTRLVSCPVARIRHRGVAGSAPSQGMGRCCPAPSQLLGLCCQAPRCLASQHLAPSLSQSSHAAEHVSKFLPFYEKGRSHVGSGAALLTAASGDHLPRPCSRVRPQALRLAPHCLYGRWVGPRRPLDCRARPVPLARPGTGPGDPPTLTPCGHFASRSWSSCPRSRTAGMGGGEHSHAVFPQHRPQSRDRRRNDQLLPVLLIFQSARFPLWGCKFLLGQAPVPASPWSPGH